MSITKLYEKAERAVNTGTVAFKGCMEHLNQGLDEIELLHDIAKNTGVKFGVKIGGPTAKFDASLAESFGADFIVAPCVESKYTATKAIEISTDEGVGIDIMIETDTALRTPEMWPLVAKNADCVVFGTTDIAASGGPPIDTAYAYFVDKNTPIAIGGGMTPSKAVEIAEEYSWVRYIETRNCRLDTKCTDNLAESVRMAVEFEIAFCEYVGDFDAVKTLEERLGYDSV